MDINISACNGLRGTVKVPGDKSISHRAVMLGSLANGITRVSNFLNAEDPCSTINCMKHLGVNIQSMGTNLKIYGTGLNGLRETSDVLDAGNSGTTVRLLSGILAAQDFHTVITGDSSLRRRPMARVVNPLRKMGAIIDGRKKGTLIPLSIRGRRLKGTSIQLEVASAQVKSAVLLAGLYAEGETRVVEPANTRDHTERMLKQMGAILINKGTVTWIKGGNSLNCLDISIPGDFSSAAFLITAASIVEGSELYIPEVGINPSRTGLLEVLNRMGADISIENKRTSGGEPVADIFVKYSRLKAVEIGGEIIPKMIDDIPALAVAASVAEGTTVIRNAEELKVKESDRITATVHELSKMGAQIKELPDGMEITGVERLKGAVCFSHNDHRIAMALAVAGLVAHGQTTVTCWECTDISFPRFIDVLRKCQGIL